MTIKLDVDDPFRPQDSAPGLDVDDPFKASAQAAPAAPLTRPTADTSDGDFMRGLKRTLPELKQLAGGTMAAIGDVTGWDGLRDKGLDIYKAQEDKLAPLTRPTDSASEAWKQVKEGNLGAGVDFLQNAAGYTAGQALESLAAAGAGAVIGGIAGSEVPVAGNAAGAVIGGIGGFVGKQALKRGVKEAAEKIIEKQVAKGVAKDVAKREAAEYVAANTTKEALTEQLGKQYTQRELAKLGGKVAGAAAGAQGLNTVMEVGSVYPDALHKAQDEGRELTGQEQTRALLSSFGAAGLESAADLFNLGVLFRGVKGAAGSAAREGLKATLGDYAKRAAVASTEGAVREAGTEGAQTFLERYGANQSLDDADAWRDYIDSAAVGAVGGVLFGAGAAVHERSEGKGDKHEPVEFGGDHLDTARADFAEAKASGDPAAAQAAAENLANALIEAKRAMRTPEQPTTVPLQYPGEPVTPTFGQPAEPAQAEPASAEQAAATGLRAQANELATSGPLGSAAALTLHQQAETLDAAPAGTLEAAAQAEQDKRDAENPSPPPAPWVDGSTGELREATDAELKQYLHDAINAQSDRGIDRKAIERNLWNLGVTRERTNDVWKSVTAERKAGFTAPATTETADEPADRAGPTTADVGTEGLPARGEDRGAVTADQGGAESGVQGQLAPTATAEVANAPAATPAQTLIYDTSEDQQDADLGAPSGGPFTIEDAAHRAASRVEGGKVFPVEGGFVVRVPQGANGTDVQTTTGTDASRVRGALNVRMGDKEFPVDSVEDASAKFLQLRDAAKGELGGMPAVHLIDQQGRPVGYIGHNGEVYEGPLGTGDNKAVPVYDPKTQNRYGSQPIEGEAARAEPQQALPAPADVHAAAHEAATSPQNDLPEPTDAQKEAGNYKKGHVQIGGLDISIENPAGSKRRPEWPALAHHYGYIKGTVGKDKDHVDVFLTEHAADTSRPVFVVDQRNQKGGFDEHKVVLGVQNVAEARKAYLANYSKGWTGAGAITQMTHEQFDAWVRDPNKSKMPASRAKVGLVYGESKKAETEAGAAKEAELNAKADVRTLPGRQERGVPAAEIAVAQDGKAWRFRASYNTGTHGAGAPFSTETFADAAAARLAAREQILRLLPKKATGADKAQADRIRAWLDEQAPSHPAQAPAQAQATDATTIVAKRQYAGLARITRRNDGVAYLRRTLGVTKAEAERMFDAIDRQGLKEGTRYGNDVVEAAEQAKQAQAAPPKAEPEKANTEDAGEELWANRRASLGKGLQWSDIKDLNAALKVKEATKSKVWPRPDYQALIDAGMTVHTAHVIKQVYDGIANKPRVRGAPTDEQLQQYVETVGRIRDAAFEWAKEEGMGFRGEESSVLNTVFPIPEGSKTRWRNADGSVNQNNALALLTGGDKLVKAIAINVRTHLAAAEKAIKAGWPGTQEAWKNLYKITMRGDTTWSVSRAGRYIERGLATREDAEAVAQRHYEANKKAPKPQPTEQSQSVEEAVREGVQHRAPDEDITSDRLQETFGFKGVNFGNWMKGDTPAKRRERQLHLNAAYDAMMDLADLVGVPAKALSLNGTLGIAFGAQGHGGRAAAHFVPGVNEINITRAHGAGSLAHEWAHALDHYFAVQSGERGARAAEPFLTDLSLQQRVDAGIRPEIAEAFQKIVQAMRARPVTAEELAKRDEAAGQHLRSSLNRALDVLRDNLPVGDTSALADFNELASRLQRGDTGEGRVETGRKVPGVMPRSRIAETVSQTAGQMLSLMREAGSVDGRALDVLAEADSRAAGIRLQGEIVEQRASHEPQTVRSEYLREAGKLESSSGKAYWTTPWELFARAFQSYVIDRLGDRQARNDYLSRPQMDEATTKAAKELGIEKGDRYPRGAERTRINEAFDTLIGALQSRESEDGKVALFSRRGWDKDFPDAVLGHPQGMAQAHPDYAAAKAGDDAAALRLARDLVTPEYVNAVRGALKGAKPTIVPVLAEEASGQNRIPLMVAKVLGQRLGLPVTTDIMQADKVSRGGSGGFHRLANAPAFDGQVKPGEYLILDDTLTQGGTLAALKTHIEDQGGKVLLASALTGKGYSAKIALSDAQLSRLRERYGSIEGWWRDTFGYGFEGLTESEARFILALRDRPSPEALRDRVDAARVRGIGEVGGHGTDQDPRARLTSDPEKSSSFDVDQVVEDVSRRWINAPTIKTVEAAEDLPQHIVQTYRRYGSDGSDVRGVYDPKSKTIFVVRGNVRSRADVETTLFHESVGHHGLRLIFGDDTVRQVRRLQNAIGGWGGIMSYAKKNGIDLSAYAALKRDGRLTEEQQADVLMDELFAHMAEHLDTLPPTLAQRVREFIGAVRAWLRQNGFTALAGDLSDAELAHLLRRAHRAVLGEESALAPNLREDPRFRLNDSFSLLENNGSGDSSASLEAIGRRRDDMAGDRMRVLIDRDGSVRALLGVDAVDTHARAGQIIVQRNVGRDTWSVLSQGNDVTRDLAAGRLNAARGKLDELAADDSEPRFSFASARDDLNDALATAGNNLGDVRLPAGYVLGDLFQRHDDGSLHWWHKTVGTQFNLAQREPEFRRVFDSVQNMVSDISHYANGAMDLAPGLLPKFDSWRDVTKKKPLAAADARKVSTAVFDGTLKWTRDEDGKVVPAKDAADGGIVWTDAELRQRFGMSDRQVDLYRQTRAAIDRSLDDTAISQMIRFAGDDAMMAREEMLAAGSARRAAVVLRDRLMEDAAQDPGGRGPALLDTAGRVMDIADQVDRLKDRGYAPLSRFGRFTVYRDGADPLFLMFESKREANRALRNLKASDPKGQYRIGTMSEDQFKQFKGLTPETLELFGEMLGLDRTGNEAEDLVFQSFLKAAKSNRSALKRLIHREGIAGYSDDVARVLASFLYSNARLTATNLHAPETAQAIKAIPKENGELKDAALKLNDYVTNPDDAGAWLQGFNFAQYLGGSIASALVNMTQPITMSFPWLSQYGGAWAAARALKDGAALAVRQGSTGDHLLDAALKRADADGHTQPQEVHQLQAYAAGRGVLRSGDGTQAGDAAAKAFNAKARVMLAWGLPFSLAEQFNRRTTFIAAWKTAKEQGMPDPYGFAVQAVQATQGIYNKANKPAWSRNAIGGMAFTFKQYSINYVEMLHRMWKVGGKEGKRGVLLAAATMFLIAGAGGLPGADDLDDLIDGLMQRLGYNFSTKQAREKFFASIMGETAASFMERGLSAVPGMPVDVSGRLGMGNLLPATGLLVRKDDHSRDVMELAGPTGDFASRTLQGADALSQGQIGAAMLSIAPRAAANWWKGVEMATTGEYRDTRGRKVVSTDAADAASKFIGFQPVGVARVQQAGAIAQGLIANYRIASSDIAARWAQGLYEHDPDAVQGARDDLEAWNRKNPDMPMRITSSQLRSRLRNLAMDKPTRLAKTAPSAVREAVREQVTVQ